MSGLTAEQVEQISAACHSNLPTVAQALNASLGTEYELKAGATASGTEAVLTQAHAEAGIALTVQFDDTDDVGLVCLIPESLPLPPWYRNPDESQRSQLQGLSTELSAAIVPADLNTARSASVTCENLRRHLEACQPDEEVQLLELQAVGPDGENAPATLQLVMPVVVPLQEELALVGDEAQPVTEEPSATVNETAGDREPEAATPETSPQTASLESRMARLRGVPVNLTVRIAEKRIDLRQLRKLSLGTLVTFDKPCDALLDIYVGDRLYCRGEAVKVGETFGIKVDECNSKVIREKKVHQV